MSSKSTEEVSNIIINYSIVQYGQAQEIYTKYSMQNIQQKRGTATPRDCGDCVTQLEFSTLPNITHIKHPRLRKSTFLQGFLQLPWRLQDFFLREHPRSPMDTKRFLAFCILEDIHRIVRIGVHGTHYPSGFICANGDKSKVKWAS